MTVTPPAPPHRRRRARIALLVASILTVCYVAACLLAPVPAPDVRVTAPMSVALPAGSDVEVAVHASELPSAAGWLDGTEVWSNDETAYPLASLTKLVTALVGLEQEPLELGDDGAEYTWTAADVALQDELIANDGVAFPIEEGTAVTQLRMLALALIPSANDFAIAYAHSLFGTDEAFLAAVDEWKHRNGIESLSVAEPSGMSPDNLANAADVVRIARLALKQPVIADLVRQPSIDVPWGYGQVENTNPLFGLGLDLVGVKTGYTEDAGYNLVSAATSVTGGRALTGIAVVLGRDTEDERLADSLALLDALASSPRELRILDAGTELATVHGANGSTATLVTHEALSAVLAPGEVATLTAEARRDGSTSARVELPHATTSITTHRVGTLTEPDLWWRLTHPGRLFG